MAKISATQRLVPSVLDRLIDDDPQISTDIERSRAQLLRDLKQSVRRDLQNLLNTHLPWHALPESYSELEQSVLNYGLPNFNTLGVSSEDQRKEFAKIIESTIARFETRLKNISVDSVENSDSADRTLRLKIKALLYVEPELEPIAFQSVLEPASQAMVIQDDYYDG